MRETFEIYEQFCLEKNKNVLLEEHFLEDGSCYFVCKHKDSCTKSDCKCIQQLSKSIQISKTFQK